MTAASPRVGSRPVHPSFPPVPLPEVARIAGGSLRGDPGTLVHDATHDLRDVRPGALFFCVPGANVDGHALAVDALGAGAVALVVERWLDLDAAQVLVGSTRAAMGPVSAFVFGDPAASMTLVGVTGTNGKTTVTYVLESVFRRAGLAPGVIGTTGARIDGTPVALARTTPEAPDLQRLLARMRAEGVRAVAMEVSSHALAYKRVGGIVFDAAMFTNLSQDHLDFHPSMEEYFAAKASLFAPGRARRGVLNADDPWGRRLREAASIPVTTFAVDADAEVRAEDVRVDARGIGFTVDGTAVRSELRGAFNVSNCVGAFAVARAVGIDDDVTAAGIGEVTGVPGRMEPVDVGQPFLVVVDYAHTPDSIHSVLRGARPLAAGRVIVVFGCGGDRDRAKRSLMGAAATTEADLSILTSDNPRSEDPLAIIDEIEVGARTGSGAYRVEPDRRRAIALAVDTARPGDVVVIAGKGHETEQEIGDTRVPFDDREVAREALTALGEGA
jgi:UDP-N-acetylmuramoyl-L-alanyl-D-glutamate--2,6-diaminopimelate ligase